MRPCSCARRPTDAHMSSRTHPRTPTYIHPCMHMHTHIRAREGVFLTTNLFYNIVKLIYIISPTSVRHHSLLLSNHCTIQSILAPYWLHYLYKLSSFVTHFPQIYHSLSIIFQPFINICCSYLTHTHSAPYNSPSYSIFI